MRRRSGCLLLPLFFSSAGRGNGVGDYRCLTIAWTLIFFFSRFHSYFLVRLGKVRVLGIIRGRITTAVGQSCASDTRGEITAIRRTTAMGGVINIELKGQC